MCPSKTVSAESYGISIDGPPLAIGINCVPIHPCQDGLLEIVEVSHAILELWGPLAGFKVASGCIGIVAHVGSSEGGFVHGLRELIPAALHHGNMRALQMVFHHVGGGDCSLKVLGLCTTVPISCSV